LLLAAGARRNELRGLRVVLVVVVAVVVVGAVDSRKSQEREEVRLWRNDGEAGPLARRTGVVKDAEDDEGRSGRRERRRKRDVFGAVVCALGWVGDGLVALPWKSGPRREASLRLEALIDW
jgi:hypothetical protein